MNSKVFILKSLYPLDVLVIDLLLMLFVEVDYINQKSEI